MTRIGFMLLALTFGISCPTSSAQAQAMAAGSSGPLEVGELLSLAADAPSVLALAAAEDTLYRAARTALNRREYDRAIAYFERLREEEPESIHLADARYYEALARLQRAIAQVEGREEGGETLLAELERGIAQVQEAKELLDRGQAERAEGTARVERERLLAQIESVQSELTEARATVVRGESVSVPFTVGRVSRGQPPQATVIGVGDTIRSLRAGAVPVGPVTGFQTLPSTGRAATAIPLSRIVPTRLASATTLPEGCDRDRFRERTAALHAIIDRSPELIEEVLGELESDIGVDPCAAPLRTAALSLGLGTNALSRDFLVSVLNSDPDPANRRAAIFSLDGSTDPADAELLYGVARSDEDGQVRESALVVLVSLPDNLGRDRAIGLVEAGEVTGQSAAAVVYEVLRSPGDEEAERLRRIFASTDDETLRTAVLGGLATSDRDADRRWVRERISDPGLPVDMRAIALNQAGWQGADMEFLFSLYEETAETSLRRQIIWTVAGSRAPEATDFLVRAYRDADDSELRTAAVNALTQRDDERATRALRAILRGEDPR